MSRISPIKDKEVIRQMSDYLREQNLRNYLLFRIGMNLGLAVKDLLYLKVEDFFNQSYYTSGKYRVSIDKALQEEIAYFIEDRKEGYLFSNSDGTPLSRFQLYGILREVSRVTSYPETLGGMTFRKTFAYWAYQEKKIPLAILSKYLKHHTIQYTLEFIEIDDENHNEVYLPALDL